MDTRTRASIVAIRLAALVVMIASVAALWNFMLWLPWQVDCVAGDGRRVRVRLQVRARGIAVSSTAVTQATHAFREWFFQGMRQPAEGPHAPPVHQAPWWKVMCLTGVDYFSTLGYQPGIAFLAAGALAPIATIDSGRPHARRRACRSTAGSPQQARTARAASRCSKICCRAGAARRSCSCCSDLPRPTSSSRSRCRRPTRPSTSSTTRSCRASFDHPVAVTLLLLTGLGAVFLKGFREAIGLAVVIVAIYLALNVVVIAVGIVEICRASRIPAALDECAVRAARQPDG